MTPLLPLNVDYIREEQEAGKIVYTFKYATLGILGSLYLISNSGRSQLLWEAFNTEGSNAVPTPPPAFIEKNTYLYNG